VHAKLTEQCELSTTALDFFAGGFDSDDGIGNDASRVLFPTFHLFI